MYNPAKGRYSGADKIQSIKVPKDLDSSLLPLFLQCINQTNP